MKKLQPVNNHVLIKLPEEGQDKTEGGLYIPDTAKEKPKEGEVISMATGASDEIAVGDQVIFKEYSGKEIELDKEKYILIPAADILAKYAEVESI